MDSMDSALTCNRPLDWSKYFLIKTALTSCVELRLLHDIYYDRLNETHKIRIDLGPWLCRNGTVLRAIVDLSHILTLSLFSSPWLSANTIASMEDSKPVNRYSYNSQNLLLS